MSKPLLLSAGNGKVQEFVGTATGQTVVWSSGPNEWVLGTPSSSGGGGVTWYLNQNTAAGSPTTNLPTGASGAVVKNLSATADGTSTVVASTSSVPVLPATPEIIAGFVTDVTVPGLTGIPAGLWDFNVWAQASGNITNQSYIQFKIYKYDGATAPTFIAESVPVYLYDPGDVTQYTASVLIPAGTALLASDRIYVEVVGGSTTSNRQITLHFGNGEPSHVHTTLLVPVNLATGVTGTLPVANGGTGLSSIASGSILYASSANTLSPGTLTNLSWTTVNPATNIGLSPLFVSGGAGRTATFTGGFSGTGTGGVLTLTGGNSTSGTGGAALLRGGDGGTGTGGALDIRGGSGTTANGALTLGTTTTSSVTIGATGITTTLNGTVSLANALAIGSGGTNNGSLSVTQGTVYYGDGSKLVGLAPGTSGQFLQTQGAGANPQWASAGSATTPYDLSGEFVGTPVASAVIMRFVAARAFTFGGTAYFVCVTGPTSQATFTVNVNGVSKGTVNIATSATSGTGTITSTNIAAGDLITVVATTPAAIVSPYWTLPGTV